MKQKQLLTFLLLLVAGVSNVLFAQTAVTVGSQVTAESQLKEGVPYIIYQPRNATYIKEASDRYSAFGSNSADNTGVFFFVKVSDGVYKIKSHSTGKFISKPTTTGIEAIAPVDEASAGEWNLQFDANGCIYPLCNGYGWDRGSNALWATAGASTTYSESNNVKLYKIYEVSADAITLTFDRSGAEVSTVTVNIVDGSDNPIPGITATLESTSFGNFKTGTAEALTRTTNSVLAPASYGNAGASMSYTFKITGLSSAFSFNTASADVYAMNGSGGAQPNTNRYFAFDLSIGSTETGVSTFASLPNTTDINPTGITTDGGLGHMEHVMTATDAANATSTLWVKLTLTNNNSECYAGISSLKLYTYVDPFTASDVYTINNTNSGRGALIYNSDNPKYVWSSGKSGTFDASQANSQWVIYPTGTEGQYYLYNVGAGKFAIPTGISTGTGYPWIFSDNAVAVIFEDQSDGTKKIRMATAPVNGTNAAYISVSNGYEYPIFNYNDDGSKFTITKVDGVDQSTAANAAVAKLVKNQTALTSFPQATGWYAIQIKSKTGSASYAGRYLQTATSLYNNLYPLTFTGGVDVQPAITDPTFFTHIDYTSWDVNNWQLPDGRYLVVNSSSKFPTPSATADNVICGYDNGNYFKTSSNWYADPYNANANYFIGETTSMRTAYTVYPIDLSDAGLVAWQAICDNAPDNAQITCSRSDVSGLTSVYKNGYFFLPTGVTPEESDFTLDGASGITIDGTAHTITFAYDPNLAIVADGVIVEQGWQTAGRDSEVMLLKVTAKPFKDATNTTLTINLKDGSEANISTLKLYESNSSSPEIYSTGDGAPTKTEVATASISGATATFTIGNLTAGTHYYWIGATVSSTATLGAVLDAAVTGIAYQVEGQTAQDLDLTSVGDPADRGAMVFNVRSYPFLPRDNGSRVYRIPAMVVADDGSIVVACDKRYDSYRDIGGGHVIDIVIRRSTDGGKTWSEPMVVAKGDNSSDATCGYGDPSLYKDNDGKIYCLFAAGNIGYFYGLNRICMSVSEDNGVTWSSSAANPPADLVSTGKVTDHASSYGSNTCYGLYDYFVTSGRGLCTSEGYLMALLPAQPYTNSTKTEKTSNSQDYIFYSTDKGATWHISENAIFVGGDEAKIIQANDGSLLASIRQGNNRGFNTATYTLNNDGTLTFTMGTQWNNSQLNAGGNPNNQDIFYYQRETDEGKTDIIFHSMTTGQHANLKLYYSTDKGQNWTEFLNVQTKATRYVTMEKSPAGSLYLLFEDQSLNDAGGYTDYNHYPINFLEITRDQLVQLIPAINEYQVPEYLEATNVKVVYGTTSHTTYGSLSGNTWTSNAASGMAGVTLTKSDGSFNQFSNWNGHFNLAYAPAANDTPSTLTLTAPDGYIIKGYSLLAAKAYSAAHTYTLTAADGTTITPAFASSATGYTTLEVSGVNAQSTTIEVTTTDKSKYLAIADFTVTLAKTFPLNVVGDASYATLYLPYDVTTTGATKAYYIATATNGKAQLTPTGNEGCDIPARTAVVLVNSEADASTVLSRTSGLSSDVSEDANLLKGTLVPMFLDLSNGTNNYSLGKLDGEIGFYKFNNGGATTITLGANKAYLEAPASGGAVKGFVLDFGGEDGIGQIVNGKSVNGKWYNLAGQRVGNPTRGVYIVGGKKVVVK